jgi:hypothetical protein
MSIEGAAIAVMMTAIAYFAHLFSRDLLDIRNSLREILAELRKVR